MGVNGQQRVRQNNSSSPSSSFVCVCVGVWLVKHSGILTSRAVSLVSNLWPFFTLAACACCVIILIRQHTTTTTGRWCWPFIQMGHKSMRVWYLTILSSLIIIYKFRPDVSSLRKKNIFPFFFLQSISVESLRYAYDALFIARRGRPSQTTGPALKRCQTRFPSRVNNGEGMLQTNWIWRSSPVRPFSLLPRQHNVSRQVRRPGGRTSLAPTNTTKRIKRRKKKEKSQREKKKKKSETSVLYDTWRVEAYHSTTLWAPFLIKGGPLTPRWEFSWKVGGRHGASDGPLAFAYHQLPPLILHPPRSNCDGQHSWHITHVWFIDGHETSRAIALCTQAGRQERDYTPAAPIFQSNFSIPRIFFFPLARKKEGNHPSIY